MSSGRDFNLRSIKEEMRLAIACEWLSAGSVLKSGGTYQIGDVSLLEKMRGSEIPYETTSYTSNAFYLIKDAVREKYKIMGLDNEAKMASKQVNRKFITSLLRKYDIKIAEDPNILRYIEENEEKENIRLLNQEYNEFHRKKRNDKYGILGILAGFFIIFIILYSIFSISYGGGDNRTEEEKRLDEYCARMGYSECSDTARDIKRISEQ